MLMQRYHSSRFCCGVRVGGLSSIIFSLGLSIILSGISSGVVQVVQGQSTSSTTTACSGPRSAGELRTKFLEGYDKFTRPEVAKSIQQGYLTGDLLQTTPPDLAPIQLHVLSLNGVDQKKNQYEMSVWLRRSWTDYRLAYSTVSQGGCFADDGRVGYPETLLTQLYHPDFYVDNLSKKLEVTAESIWIYPDGRVIWTSQLEMTLACSMEFADFPYDIQTCGFRVGTYLEDASSVQLLFFENGAVTIAGIDTTEDALPHGGTTEWTIAGATPVFRSSQGGALQEESYVEINFDFKRNSEYYTDFVIVPCVMFVAIGWASFFLSRAAAPARVAMSMIVFLSNTNFLASQLGQLPRLGSDVWLFRFMSVSQVFTFYSILEYVLCNYLRRIEGRIEGARKKARENRNVAANVEKGESDGGGGRQGSSSLPEEVTKQEILATGFNYRADMILMKSNGGMILTDEQVDVFSRYAYPVAYVAAFVVLWFTR